MPRSANASAMSGPRLAAPTPASWPRRVRRVRQRPEEVEDRADAQFAPRSADVPHRRVKRAARTGSRIRSRRSLARPPRPPRSSRAPSASSRSALPHFDDAARLPCFATRTPGRSDDETRRGRDVERVDAVAARAADVDDVVDRHRFRVCLHHGSTQAATTSGVSPRMRSAARKAPICAGVALAAHDRFHAPRRPGRR